MHLSDDKRQAALEINGVYDAAQLEGLIEELSALRASMAPPVPATPPPKAEGDDAAAQRARGDPTVQVAVMRDGITRFWVRHCGLGWFGFNLPVDRANLLASHILELTTSRDRSMDLSRLKRRQSDVCH
jgi:hypothetical protein